MIAPEAIYFRQWSFGKRRQSPSPSTEREFADLRSDISVESRLLIGGDWRRREIRLMAARRLNSPRRVNNLTNSRSCCLVMAGRVAKETAFTFPVNRTVASQSSNWYRSFRQKESRNSEAQILITWRLCPQDQRPKIGRVPMGGRTEIFRLGFYRKA